MWLSMRRLREQCWATLPWRCQACLAMRFRRSMCAVCLLKDLPLILLARLAVDRRFARRGLGHALISEALRISLRGADEVGCRSIITDAYRDRVSWYARYGFVPIEGAAATGPQRMFLDLRTVRAALQD